MIELHLAAVGVHGPDGQPVDVQVARGVVLDPVEPQPVRRAGDGGRVLVVAAARRRVGLGRRAAEQVSLGHPFQPALVLGPGAAQQALHEAEVDPQDVRHVRVGRGQLDEHRIQLPQGRAAAAVLHRQPQCPEPGLLDRGDGLMRQLAALLPADRARADGVDQLRQLRGAGSDGAGELGRYGHGAPSLVSLTSLPPGPAPEQPSSATATLHLGLTKPVAAAAVSAARAVSIMAATLSSNRSGAQSANVAATAPQRQRQRPGQAAE